MDKEQPEIRTGPEKESDRNCNLRYRIRSPVHLPAPAERRLTGLLKSEPVGYLGKSLGIRAIGKGCRHSGISALLY